MLFKTEDWEKFRTIEGLCQKAGVTQAQLAMLIPKELVDNALDSASYVRIFPSPRGVFAIWNNGPGIDPEELSRLFSFSRPFVSTKFFR